MKKVKKKSKEKKVLMGVVAGVPKQQNINADIKISSDKT